MSAITCEAITTVASSLGDAVHQQLQELAAGERVEARERLVEEEQRRPLAERDGEREPRSLARRSARHASVLRETGEEVARDRGVPAAGWCARANSSVSPTVKER